MYPLIDAPAIVVTPHWMRNGANDNDPRAQYVGQSVTRPDGAAGHQAFDQCDGLVTKGLDKLRTSWRRRRVIRELDRLSDRNLADIGLHRGEIVSVVDRLVAGGAANDNHADLVA